MIIKGAEVEIKKDISKKTGKEYCLLSIKFPNGYVIRSFPNFEQQFILKDYLDGASHEGK